MNKPIKGTNVNILKNESGIISDKKLIAENFNEHFIKLGPDLAREIPSTTLNPCTYVNLSTSKFNFKHISGGQVVAGIRNISSKKASGLDKIPCNVIKGAAGIISESLSIIFNKSLINGIFPDDVKSARVAPIFKSGERSDVSNYRPISVLLVIGKVFKKIFCKQFYEYLSDNSLFSQNQSGFRPRHSLLRRL